MFSLDGNFHPLTSCDVYERLSQSKKCRKKRVNSDFDGDNSSKNHNEIYAIEDDEVV